MKNSNIVIRVTDEEKNKLIHLLELTGYDNMSNFIRSYINEVYDFLCSAPKGLDLDLYIEKLKQDRDKEKDSFSKYKYNQKIRMLEEIKALKL